MAKKLASAAEIQAEIQRRISESTALEGRCRHCKAPTPRRIEGMRHSGVSWTVDSLLGVESACTKPVMSIVSEVMREYDLD